MSSSAMTASARDSWSSRTEFLLACLGSGMGIRSLYAFPYICYSHGGASFLVPYLIMVSLCAQPLLYMEIAVGQLTRAGPVQAIGMLCPLLKGVGMAMVMTCFFTSSYHIAMLTWTLHYFFASFKSSLPWSVCDERWSDSPCVVMSTTVNFTGEQTTSSEFQGYGESEKRSTKYFTEYVLQKSKNESDLGGLNAALVGYLFLAWILCYLCLFKGVRSIGKVVYVTTLLPYLVLCILLIRLFTLPGAAEGFYHFFYPSLSRISDLETALQTWLVATREAFYCVGIASGIMITFPSYADKRNRISVSTLIITVTNVCTNLLAGCVISAATGALASIVNVPIADVVNHGYNAVFVMMPSLFSKLPMSNLWAVLFFLSLICLQINYQLSLVQVVVTTISDQFRGKMTAVLKRRELMPLVVCAVTFLFGLIHVSRGGTSTLNFVDYYLVYLPSYIIIYLEVLAICFIFGGNRLAREISFLSGYRSYFHYTKMWAFVVPLPVTCYMWYGLVEGLRWADWATPWPYHFGILLSILCLISIPIGVLHELYKNGQGKSFCSAFMVSVTPTFVPEHVKRKQWVDSREWIGREPTGDQHNDELPLVETNPPRSTVDGYRRNSRNSTSKDVDQSAL